jgi:hypothetical protein
MTLCATRAIAKLGDSTRTTTSLGPDQVAMRVLRSFIYPVRCKKLAGTRTPLSNIDIAIEGDHHSLRAPARSLDRVYIQC